MTEKIILTVDDSLAFEELAQSRGFRLIAVWDEGDGSLYIYRNEGEFYDYWTYWYGLVPFRTIRVEQVDERGEIQNAYDLFVSE